MSRFALLLIDIQNDYFPGGAMELKEPEAAAKNAARLLSLFRELGWTTVHIQHHTTRAGATFFLPGTEGALLHESILPQPGEAVVTKHFPNSFHKTELERLLRGAETEELVVAGMMTHMCVDATVRAAMDHGYPCWIASDACATRDLSFAGRSLRASEVQTAFLAALNGTYGTIHTTEELLGQLRRMQAEA